MDFALKTEWLAALRSGEYLQCQQQLYNGESLEKSTSFCCLGVLATIANLKSKQIANSILPKLVGGQKIISSLIHMNDGYESYKGRPQDFWKIANWIEQNIPGE